MTATFGCLDGAVLELQDGLNCIVLPNERGKSTWAAFLTAMFYGVDTSQRSVKGRIADKNRYQPWNGKPMSGTVELERDGQILVLQRTSERGKPLGVFRAWDRETGLAVDGLTGENCGRKLLGVERAVFQRSAFLSGADLTVTQDQDLARRLGALAAAGRESDSYPQAESKLKLWQNRCRYHKTGRIPETEARLQKTQAMLEEAEDLRRQRLHLTALLEQQEDQIRHLEEKQKKIAAEKKQALSRALEQAHVQAEIRAAKTAALPPEETLQRLQAVLSLWSPEETPEPPCPPALEGLTAEQIWPKAQRDLAEYERLTALQKKGETSFLIMALFWLVLMIPMILLKNWWSLLLLGGLSGFGWFRWIQQRRHNRQVSEAAETAQALLDSYDVKQKDALLTAAMTRRDWLLAVERAERQAWELAVSMDEIRVFAPDTETPAQAVQAVQQALEHHGKAREARQALEAAQLQWQNRGALTQNPDLEALRRQKIRSEAELEALVRQEQSMGSWETLQAEAQQLEAQLEELQLREQALILARQALASANGQLAQVYAPQVTRLAGTYLNALTQGRYDNLLLEPDLTLSVREAASGLVRPLTVLSRGTQDQTWLALRLSMTQLLLPADTPILLDDALLTFDRNREQATLAVLNNENRQVIFFSCR